MVNSMPSKGAIYSTENRLEPKIAEACRKQLRESFDGEIISVSLKPIDFGDKRIVLDLEPGYLTMFTQFLAGLEASTADYIFMTEHDVLYPPEHFDFTPPTKNQFWYDLNWWKIRSDGLAVRWKAAQVSGLCAYRELLIDYYKERIRTFDKDNFDRKFEPASGKEGLLETWEAPVPHIDVRHSGNLTFNKWRLSHFRNKATAVNLKESRIENIDGWNLTAKDIYG